MKTLPALPKSTWRVLRILCDEQEGITAQNLASISKTSKRMIYYDLENVKYALAVLEIGELNHNRCGYFLHDEQKDSLRSILLQSEEIHDKDDRVSYMIIRMLFHEDIIRLESFCEKFEVSRNTILRDLNEVKSLLEDHQLYLLNTKKEGYFVEGDIFRKRMVFLDHVKQLLKHIHYTKLDFFDTTIIEEYTMKLNKVFQKVEITASQHDVIALALLLLTMRIAPMNYRFNVADLSNICATKELKVIDKYFSELSYHERIYLAIQLLGYGSNRDFLDQNTEPYHYLQELAIQLVDMFEKVSCLRFDHKEELVNSIYMHMKLSYYNYCYSIPSMNPLLDDIKENYSELVKITELCCEKLKEQFPYPYFDSEITYLTMHFASFLRRDRKEKACANVILVCLNSTAGSMLLRNEIENQFENINIVDILNQTQVNAKVYEQKIDFIISTVELTCEYPMIRVNPILSTKDKANIASFMMLSASGYKVDNQQLKVVLQILQRNVDTETFIRIRDEICDYMNAGGSLMYLEENRQVTLCELLEQSSIVLDASYGVNWMDAIWECAQPLLEQRCIEKNYITRMIELIHGYGPYIVISQRIAIAHAQPEDGVLHLGISLHIYPKGLTIGNTSIQFLFVLATPNQSDHLHILQDIMTLNEHEEYMNQIVQAENAKQVMYYLQDLLKEDL